MKLTRVPGRQLASNNNNNNNTPTITVGDSPPPASNSSVAPDPSAAKDTSSSVSAVSGKKRPQSLNIHSDQLDVELIKYLYRVYFNKKVLRHELAAKMKRQSTTMSSAAVQHQARDKSCESTPKRVASTLLRVTYFDDFDLFRTAAVADTGKSNPTTTSHGQKTSPSMTVGSGSKEASSSRINYCKSNSANELDACPVTQQPRAPNKTHSLDKPYHHEQQQQQQQQNQQSWTSSTVAGVGGGGSGGGSGVYGVSTVCATTSSIVSNASSTTELFESSRSLAEDEYKTPRSNDDSSSTSIGLVSCTSKVSDGETTVTPVAPVVDYHGPCDCESNTNKVGDLSDISCCSVASSATTTLRSSLDHQLSDYHSVPSPPGTLDSSVTSPGTDKSK